MRTFNEDHTQLKQPGTNQSDWDVAEYFPHSIGGGGSELGAITDTRRKVDRWLRARNLIRSRKAFTR